MSFTNDVPGSFSKDFETTAVQKEYKRSYANCLDEERNKILLKYTSKPAESCEKTCEAKIIDSTHPENTPLIYEWISKCEEMIKTGELTFLEMEKKCTTMEAQLDESSQVDQELSLKSVENDDEYFDDNCLFKTLFKTLLKYRSKPAENLKRKREAEDLDATDPEDILGSLAPSYEKNTSSEHSGINLEMEKELCPEDTPLIYEWISKCEEMIKTGELTFLEMEKKCTTMEAQLDESSRVDQELSSESVENKKHPA